jgi:hypothetical protein
VPKPRAVRLLSVYLAVKPVGEPDAGDRHVRFDERGWETERCRMAQATAPILDSTGTDQSARSNDVCSSVKTGPTHGADTSPKTSGVRPIGPLPGSAAGASRRHSRIGDGPNKSISMLLGKGWTSRLQMRVPKSSPAKVSDPIQTLDLAAPPISPRSSGRFRYNFGWINLPIFADATSSSTRVPLRRREITARVTSRLRINERLWNELTRGG